MEIIIGAFVALISLSYLVEICIAPPEWGAFLTHSFAPQFDGSESIMLAVGIIGATVMPHAIYLHSSLTQNRVPVSTVAERRRVLAFSNREVLLALGLAGLVNMAMIAMSSDARLIESVGLLVQKAGDPPGAADLGAPMPTKPCAFCPRSRNLSES